MDEIVAYFNQHFGPVDERSLIEIVPFDPAITVHVVPASEGRNHITLFTTGMSSEQMTVPDEVPDNEDFAYAELFIQLPSTWKYARIDDADAGWPIHWLRSMAKLPHQLGTWLGGPVVVLPNGEPMRPLAPNTRFSAIMLMAERQIHRRDGRPIQLYRMTPLFPEEYELESHGGIGALLRAFDQLSIPFIVDNNRPSIGGVALSKSVG